MKEFEAWSLNCVHNWYTCKLFLLTRFQGASTKRAYKEQAPFVGVSNAIHLTIHSAGLLPSNHSKKVR